MKGNETLYIVIPCYNEQEVLPETHRRLHEKLDSMIGEGLVSKKSRMVFVDDGSKDATWELIRQFYEEDELTLGIRSSRNRGHQNTLLGGLLTVANDCDMVISMDADLQDDIGVMDEFVRKYYGGCDIVYGVRASRRKDTFFKKVTAEAFYRLLNAMGVEVVFNHADYRLMSRRAIMALSEYKEVNLYLRGMIPMIGFKTDIVEYERAERFAGESKYPFSKMLALAVNGITSLSVRPIRMITGLGIALFIISIILLVYYTIGYFLGRTIHGWATLVVSIWALGGLQLLAIGVIGEYIGKIYLETKGRPRFIVDTYLSEDTRRGTGTGE